MKNTIHLCDNLELLQKLENESVDLIYCDILYGTGREFNDYTDLQPIKQVIESFYIPRITEMYRVLKTTGSIYLQMDCRISHWLRCILDDIFGYDRFKNEIIYKRSLGVNSKYNHYVKNNDRILLYVKSDTYTFNHAYTPLSSESISRYNRVDSNGERYCLMQNYNTNSYKKGCENDFRVIGNEKFYVKQGMGFSISQKEIDRRISQGVIFERNTVGSSPLNISLTSGDVLPAVNSAISVASGTGKALGGDVTLDVANNALGQKGIVSAPTALNANQVWGTDAAGNPSWTTTNGAIVKKDVISNNSNLTVANGTQQIVGANDLTLDLTTNNVTTSGSSALAITSGGTGSVVGGLAYRRYIKDSKGVRLGEYWGIYLFVRATNRNTTHKNRLNYSKE